MRIVPVLVSALLIVGTGCSELLYPGSSFPSARLHALGSGPVYPDEGCRGNGAWQLLANLTGDERIPDSAGHARFTLAKDRPGIDFHLAVKAFVPAPIVHIHREGDLDGEPVWQFKADWRPDPVAGPECFVATGTVVAADWPTDWAVGDGDPGAPRVPADAIVEVICAGPSGTVLLGPLDAVAVACADPCGGKVKKPKKVKKQKYSPCRKGDRGLHLGWYKQDRWDKDHRDD